jgi:D-glycero-alpha-D-manno-heptose-7-phosphate kinase
MLITKSSLRVSLVGGGSDLESYLQEIGSGKVISFAINKYIYITSNRYHEPEKISFKYSLLETHDKASKFKNPIIREVLKCHGKAIRGREFGSFSEIPGGTGLGSSSSFCGNFIYHINSLNNLSIDNIKIAKDAAKIEVDILREPIGRQDHYGSLVGGLKKIEFLKNETIVKKIKLTENFQKFINENMVLVKIGEQRSASKILENVSKGERESIKANAKDLVSLVKPLNDAFIQEDYQEINKIIKAGWRFKKEMSNEISNNYIDDLYDFGLKNGACSGKLCGAGGSGYMFFFCNDKELLKEKLKDNILHEIAIEPNPLQRTVL